MTDSTYAVAVRDQELFLFLRIRRAPKGDIYVINPTGRPEAEWKKYKPHGSYHADGRFHHKAFDRKILKRQGLEPDPHSFAARALVCMA